jgi:hypothetical protein
LLADFQLDASKVLLRESEDFLQDHEASCDLR